MTDVIDDRITRPELPTVADGAAAIGQSFEPQLRELRARLAARYGHLPHDTIVAAVASGWAHTASFRLQTYRLVFVERHARAALEDGSAGDRGSAPA